MWCTLPSRRHSGSTGLRTSPPGIASKSAFPVDLRLTVDDTGLSCFEEYCRDVSSREDGSLAQHPIGRIRQAPFGVWCGKVRASPLLSRLTSTRTAVAKGSSGRLRPPHHSVGTGARRRAECAERHAVRGVPFIPATVGASGVTLSGLAVAPGPGPVPRWAVSPRRRAHRQLAHRVRDRTCRPAQRAGPRRRRKLSQRGSRSSRTASSALFRGVTCSRRGLYVRMDGWPGRVLDIVGTVAHGEPSVLVPRDWGHGRLGAVRRMRRGSRTKDGTQPEKRAKAARIGAETPPKVLVSLPCEPQRPR